MENSDSTEAAYSGCAQLYIAASPCDWPLLRAVPEGITIHIGSHTPVGGI